MDDCSEFAQAEPDLFRVHPEMQLATKLERDLLNARINFIYFITIQKEGSFDKGIKLA